MVARTRDWEQGLVGVYQAYLRVLESELKCKVFYFFFQIDHVLNKTNSKKRASRHRTTMYGCLIERGYPFQFSCQSHDLRRGPDEQKIMGCSTWILTCVPGDIY